MRPAASDQTLRHAAGETVFYVGSDARERGLPALADWAAGRQVFIISSEAVLAAQPDTVEAVGEIVGTSRLLLVPDGEGAKSLSCAESLWSALIEAGGTRDSRIIGVGGGSVGDLAGFVAATFLRGVELALLPTTLLAQVDAAIGGKMRMSLPRRQAAPRYCQKACGFTSSGLRTP